MNELEVLSFEFSKFIMIDAMSKRYLRSYLAASILIISFEILLDRI